MRSQRTRVPLGCLSTMDEKSKRRTVETDTQESPELTNWERLLIYCPCMMGAFTLKGAIVAMERQSGGEQYFAMLGNVRKPIDGATTDNEAARHGFALLGEMLYKRLQSFEDNPFVYPVVEGDEEEVG
jgi:hypothetical protein